MFSSLNKYKFDKIECNQWSSFASAACAASRSSSVLARTDDHVASLCHSSSSSAYSASVGFSGRSAPSTTINSKTKKWIQTNRHVLKYVEGSICKKDRTTYVVGRPPMIAGANSNVRKIGTPSLRLL